MTSVRAEPETDDREGPDVGAPLDLLLADAAIGPLRRMRPGPAGLRFLGALARRPQVLADRVKGLGGELVQIAIGSSERAPSRRDKRFADDGWTGNPLLRRTMQAYLAGAETAQAIVEDVDLSWADRERVRFAVDNLLAALAPSNNPVLNPAALKEVVDTGGASTVRGLRRLVRDMLAAPRVPRMVEPDAFEVGSDLAATEGSVVLRTPVFELIQYEPKTTQVHETPMLIVPPMINKFYILDLAPGRSVVEHLVEQGQQVFAISWRNPDARHADWDLDTYGQAVVDALDAVRRIRRVPKVSMLGVCAGGILTSMVLGHLAHIGELDRVAALTLMVTVIDQERAGMTSALVDEKVAAAAAALSKARGYLDGRALSEVFAWLRPNDLVWGYWVNNYLLGRDPKPFDILYWNADSTRMPAGLHADFLRIASTNALTDPGRATMLGSPVDLGAIDVDAYVIAGIADHLCTWQNCYSSTQLLGGDSRFVLSTSGHIAALVNPPGNPKAHYQVAEDCPADPEQWLSEAQTEQGSWWEDWTSWLEKRTGEQRARPRALGGGGLPPLGDAPGSYVHDH